MKSSGWIIVLMLLACSSSKQVEDSISDTSFSGYLFTYFTGNDKSQEQVRFAISKDGFNYHALNNNDAVISSASISETGGVRDPHILRGHDNKTFYMVVTDMVSANGWNSNRGMVMMKSKDLINWTSSEINLQKKYPHQEELHRVWAPQTIYDEVAKKYMIYFSLQHGSGPDIIYYAYANKDFTDIEGEPKQLFYHPTNSSCIDGDIVKAFGKYHLFFKTEGAGNGIKKAVSEKLTEGFKIEDDKYLQQTTEPVEGAGIFKLNNTDSWIMMYDLYTKGKYQFTQSADLQHFSMIDQDVSMDFHPRHGTVIPITRTEYERLISKWGTAKDAFGIPTNPAVNPINFVFDGTNKELHIPVKPGTDLNAFDPMFKQISGSKITPSGPQDFSGGPKAYTVQLGDRKAEVYKVKIEENHNPVIQGYFADPDILYSNKTKKYYLYPTSDGFDGWSGTYFKTFSSTDLVNWKDEGVILDLKKDVQWANRNAWAPTIIEKKMGNTYKYFYYFCAEQKIGVAVSDDPSGKFKDIGKPLINSLPEDANGGQQIDPAVFHDPNSGKDFIYWGNGYMAVAELGNDMISIKPGTTKVLTPDNTFREGVYVIYRKGKYYFLWSEDDTRSENYRVRYGTSSSPYGPIEIPGNNLILAKEPINGIYGTGHNSVLNIPGTDDWYIVYHRFNYPKGITMGDAAGFHREVCIDKLEFNDDGSIRKVIPTRGGIQSLSFH